MNQIKSKEIIINGPPLDSRCDVCGKYIEDLKTFGKAGDPLVGDFNGALLVKTFRTMAPHGSVKNILKEKGINIDPVTLYEEDRIKYDKFEKELLEKYGKKFMDNYYFAMQLEDTVEASWECRECIILPEKEWWEKNLYKNKQKGVDINAIRS